MARTAFIATTGAWRSCISLLLVTAQVSMPVYATPVAPRSSAAVSMPTSTAPDVLPHVSAFLAALQLRAKSAASTVASALNPPTELLG